MLSAMKIVTTISCTSEGKILSYFSRVRSLFNSRGLDDGKGLPRFLQRGKVKGA